MHLPDRPRYFGGEANEFELGLAQVPPRLSTGYGCCRWQVPVEKVTVPFSVLGFGRSRPEVATGDRQGREAVPGITISDAGHEVVRAPGGGEGGAPAAGREPEVHRDFGAAGGVRWATIVRGGLLRSRRHGEPDQGAAVGPVCGPHVDPEAGGESTAFVFLGVRLRDDGDVATGGGWPGRSGRGRRAGPCG